MQNSKKTDKERKEKREEKKNEFCDDDEVIDLCNDHDYQVLSAVFETDSGKNIADILSRLQKDVHLLAMSVHQLIQLSIVSQSAKNDSDYNSDEDNQSDDNKLKEEDA